TYRLHCTKSGVHSLKLEVIARITKAEPWNQIAFTGPPASVASLKAEGSAGVEVELLSGALIEGGTAKAGSSIAGVIGADRVVSLRWQSKTTEIARKSLITVDTTASKSYSLTLFTETANDATGTVAFVPPQPIGIERESGTVSILADDMVVDVTTARDVRQVNAPSGTFYAYRFSARGFEVTGRARRIEPVLETATRVTARLEESRLVVAYALNLSVLKAGIYTAELTYPTNFNVTDVRGVNVEDWKAAGGKLKVNFTQRVLGTHRLDLTLEQANKTFPPQITVGAVRVTGATKETAFIGAAAAAGIRLKTEALTSSREIPIAQLSQRAGDEALAFTAEAPDWKLVLATERLPARVVAEVFNLVTVGDGIVGGSATIRFGILNQGIQEFKVRLPGHWKNVE
ncbi:MAG: hypothetical protein EBS84_22850, partial [Proteobacteria bacterium]|nr:hypothetical protein [Pseudomonadota bacterium]